MELLNEHTLWLIVTSLAGVGMVMLLALILGYNKLKKIILQDIVQPKLDIVEAEIRNFKEEIKDIKSRANSNNSELSKNISNLTEKVDKIESTLQGFMGEMRMFLKMGGGLKNE